MFQTFAEAINENRSGESRILRRKNIKSLRRITDDDGQNKNYRKTIDCHPTL